jgi:hypothetical protein
MGGGMLMALFSCGPLSAHFNAWADFLMNFSPFFYQGSVGVSIGVDFDMDLFICTIHISVDIDATLDLHGPPFGGVVSNPPFLFLPMNSQNSNKHHIQC